MIPEFPQFKKLEISDRKEIESHTKKFLPYSDFNFVSMWSWDIKGEMRISQLNGNLVVRFTDYINGKPFFSFLGVNKVQETINSLLEYSDSNHKKDYIQLVPDHVLNSIQEDSKLYFEHDPDTFDYVYEVSHLANMHNWAKHTSGKHVRSFSTNFPEYRVEHNSITDVCAEHYLDLFNRWALNRNISDKATENEFNALKRIFTEDFTHLRVVSLYMKEVLVGFTIYEILSEDYAISHFAKSDKSYHKALSDVLNWEEAKILDKHGVKYFNWEQDLGILGLRKSKEKYKPHSKLKKVKIKIKK